MKWYSNDVIRVLFLALKVFAELCLKIGKLKTFQAHFFHFNKLPPPHCQTFIPPKCQAFFKLHPELRLLLKLTPLFVTLPIKRCGYHSSR